MSVQTQFLKLNDNIKAGYKSKRELAEKRDILTGILKDDADIPSFDVYNQGSYIMRTGIKPEEGKEYDIDVALLFNVNKADFQPMELKNKIHDLLIDHTDYGAEIKKPCVTVTYKKGGEIAYHVDLVVYAYENSDDIFSQLYIAKGIPTNTESIKWEKADPKGLVTYINTKLSDEAERNQFRRVVRYLKKWKNRRFSDLGHISPASIGLTLLAVDNFIYKNEDLDALINVVSAIERAFVFVGTNDDYRSLYRIKLSLPWTLNFEKPNDVFEKMTDGQMTDFKDKISKLKSDLEAVNNEIDEYEKCKKLNKIFGDDFEVPNETEVAKHQLNYIPSSSSSGL